MRPKAAGCQARSAWNASRTEKTREAYETTQLSLRRILYSGHGYHVTLSLLLSTLIGATTHGFLDSWMDRYLLNGNSYRKLSCENHLTDTLTPIPRTLSEVSVHQNFPSQKRMTAGKCPRAIHAAKGANRGEKESKTKQKRPTHTGRCSTRPAPRSLRFGASSLGTRTGSAGF